MLAATSALVRLGASDQGTQPEEQTARRAYDLLAEGFGAGFNGPIPIVVDVNGDRAGAAADLRRRAQDLEGVASAGEPQFNDEETVAIVFVTPDLGAAGRGDRPTSSTACGDDVVPGGDGGRRRGRVRLRPRPRRSPTSPTGSCERLPLFLLYIIGVTFIVLAMAFRSIVISLTAAVTTLLSAFIGFGVLTLVDAGGPPARA